MSDSPVDEFLSVEDGVEIEHRVRGSRFLGQTFCVGDAGQVTERVHRVARGHHAARHHCWAARLGAPPRLVERSDDDGEPSGTAGRPILLRIAGQSLHDTLVVVTRYFGGTKLGKGGLARAYAEAAALALAAAPRRTVELERLLTVTFAFEEIGLIETVLARAGDAVRRIERRYEGAARLELAVKPSRVPEVRARLIDATGGRIEIGPE